MLASSDFGFRRAHTKGQSAVARVPKWVWVLSAVATGTLLLASHSARAQETESTTGTTPTPTPAITLSVNPTSVTESSTLDLSHNKLSDMIPGRLRNLSALTDLDLSDNDFSGNIPTRLNSLTSLKTLDVSNNALSGTIASRLGDLATSGSLTKFSFCGNDLTGSLPTAFHTGVSTPGIASSDYNNIAVCRRSSQ